LLYRALGWNAPSWAHAPLIVDADGKRLAKRSAGFSIRELRQKGKTPEEVLTAPLSGLLS
jgi:glutamyl-tRNA synthetase